MSKKLIWITVLLILSTVAFYFYRQFFPSGPNLNQSEVPNLVTDRASKDWTAAESAAPRNPMKDVYWGDLHVHTKYSFDAFIGGTFTTPDDAYLFAKGIEIDVIDSKLKLKRPLDFTAVTDHAEFMGEVYNIQEPSADRHNAYVPKLMREIGWDSAKQQQIADLLLANLIKPGYEPEHQPYFAGYQDVAKVWDVMIEAAEKHYEPGKFTTLTGYEWTNGLTGHVHRNVIFRDQKVPAYPISSLEARDEQQLWESLDNFTEQGSTVLAIAHNSNLSSGRAFPVMMPDGNPMDADYAKMRQIYEPLVEISQHKGSSEVHQAFWQNDEFANYENYFEGENLESNYVRWALKKGLEIESKEGVNPFKFGFIGSTDTHNSTPGNTEEKTDIPGHFYAQDYTVEKRTTMKWTLGLPPNPMYDIGNPGALAAVWAEANTRGDIYDALKNKETYGTSGGRIKVRFFGSGGFDTFSGYDEMVNLGYGQGVPMGQDLTPDQLEGQVPQFIIWATKDPESANLDRIQVIKGWYEHGILKERIFDAVASDERIPDERGEVIDLNVSVDMKTGAWDKSKGAVELQTVWADPAFDPTQEAFYYLRVLELPTPRWSLWDEIRYGVKYPDHVPKTVVERAWSSPIWYSPK